MIYTLFFERSEMLSCTLILYFHSDHAWGGNYFFASGSLDGGRILGKLLSLTTTSFYSKNKKLTEKDYKSGLKIPQSRQTQ